VALLGCECVAPCPCASIAPASVDHCRALKFYQVQTGEVDGLDLKGLVFVAAIADSPKKMYELRDWHLHDSARHRKMPIRTRPAGTSKTAKQLRKD